MSVTMKRELLIDTEAESPIEGKYAISIPVRLNGSKVKFGTLDPVDIYDLENVLGILKSMVEKNEKI